MRRNANAIQKVVGEKETTLQSAETLQTGDVIAGLEAMEREDLLLPRLALCQSMSQAVVNGAEKPGTFQNTLTGFNYGESVLVQPLLFSKGRNRWDGIRRICFSPDARIGFGDPGGDCLTCPFAEWQNGQPPECAKTIYWICQTPDGADFFALDFKRSGLSEARRIATLCKRAGINPWRIVLALSSEKTSNEKGTFFVPRVAVARRATPEETEAGKKAYLLFAPKAPAVHYEEPEE